jgi:hypothetical protein
MRCLPWPALRSDEDSIRSRYTSSLAEIFAGSYDRNSLRSWLVGVDEWRLLAMAEQGGYDLMITTDQNLRYQQNLASRQIAIVVLLSTSWPRIQRHITAIQNAVADAAPGTYQEITITW